jgi:hypothetical protein
MGLIVTSIGAVLTTLIGVLVGSALSSRSQQRQWSRDRQADACAQILRESSNVLIEFAVLSGQQIEEAPDGSPVPTRMDWRPWNEALAMISLVADYDIVEAAQAIDAEFWPIHVQIKRGWIRDRDWPRSRNPIDARRQDFVNIARKHFAASGPPLRRLTGRPAADDPFWKFRRSDFSLDSTDRIERASPESDQYGPLGARYNRHRQRWTQQTLKDGRSQVGHAAALAVGAATWLRDEEANASAPSRAGRFLAAQRRSTSPPTAHQ